jgi:uncharacterized protein (DUF1330 family)
MIETMMGLQVSDAALYAQYREHMRPLLEAHGGRFVLDLWVSEVLLAPSAQPFNRLFTVRFPSQAARDAFFTDPEYQAVRKQYYEPSVAATSTLGRFEVLEPPASS